MKAVKNLLAPKVLLCGNYGLANLGDDTILQSLVPELQNQGWEPRVLGGDPGLAEKLGIVVYPWSPWQQAVRAVADCDAVILGGGGLFQDYWGADVATLFGQHHSLTYYCGVAQTARMFHIPYAILGVGVGPVSTPLGRELVLDTFRHASYASVRDTGSQQTLQLLGLALHQIHPGADLAALTISRLQRGEREKRACNLVVNLRPWPFWPDQVRALELLARELAALARQENLKVLLLAMTRGEDPHHSDEAFLREFAGRLQQNGVEDPSLVVPASPREAAACLAPARLAVVMRYHAAMLAGALAVPFVALVYDPKVRFLLEELGCPEAGIPLAFTPGELANRLRTAPSSLAASGEKFSQLTQRAREDLTRALHALTQALGTNQRLSPLAQAALERVASEAAQLPQLQQEVAFREAEREALARKAARLAEELEETRQREAKLVEAYAERQAAVERLTHQLTELTAQLTAAEQRSAELAAGLSERQAEVERLSAKLEEAGAAYQELQQRYEHVLQAHGERQQEVERLSRELADRMADLQRFHTTLADLTSTKWFKLASLYWRWREKLRGKMHQSIAAPVAHEPGNSPVLAAKEKGAEGEHLKTQAVPQLEAFTGEESETEHLRHELACREAEREALARQAAKLAEELRETREHLRQLLEQSNQPQALVSSRLRKKPSGLEGPTGPQPSKVAVQEVIQGHPGLPAEKEGDLLDVSRLLAERTEELARLRDILSKITSSKWFRLASFYWRLTEKLRNYSEKFTLKPAFPKRQDLDQLSEPTAVLTTKTEVSTHTTTERFSAVIRKGEDKR
ncbi:MAG: polysaccharide pyruvyl transferase family protein, partial [Thermoanaerobaculum sp.]|nr:polysaccharide pyruvyl transferase family protein [Thermoanaerobaculum sp.]